MGDGCLTVNFFPPCNDGGLPISSFLIKVEPSGREVAANTSPATVTGLNNGQPYTLEVAAVNPKGQSRWSAPTNPATPRGESYGFPGLGLVRTCVET